MIIKNLNVTPKGMRPGTNRLREISAWWGKQRVGSLNLSVPLKSKSATLMSVDVPKEFRGKGISSSLFKRTIDFLSRAKFRFLRADEILHPAQVKIRLHQGRYKAGKVSKFRSRFFADQYGPWAEQTRRVSAREAIRITKENPRGQLLTATTMIKKYMGRHK